MLKTEHPEATGPSTTSLGPHDPAPSAAPSPPGFPARAFPPHDRPSTRPLASMTTRQAQAPFLNLPQIPVHVCVLWPDEASAQGAPRGDIELVYDPDSGVIDNAVFDEALLGYGETYENSLGFSEFFQGYLQGFAEDLIERHGLRGKRVIEVGCGDGDFLKLLVQKGAASAVGFDPSYTPGSPTELEDGKVQVHVEMFPPAGQEQRWDADMLVCRQVLEHVPDPLDFLRTIRSGLPTDRPTSVVFEVPNVFPTLDDLTTWDVIYEHKTYFSIGSLAHLMAKAGFAVTFAEETYEGVFITVEGTTDPNAVDRSQEFDDRERLVQSVNSFDTKWKARLAAWTAELERRHAAGEKVVIWGSGARGVNFLNLADPGHTVEVTVDINPRKLGLHVAGTGQRISEPKELIDYQPDLVIVMNGVYKDEIERSLHDMGLHPEVRVV